MPDREKSADAVGSDAVDAEFWAIVLHDEDWLHSEFDEITEPAEARISPPRPLVVSADESSSGGQGTPARHGGGIGRLGDTGRSPGQGWRRQRSPPRTGKQSHQDDQPPESTRTVMTIE